MRDDILSKCGIEFDFLSDKNPLVDQLLIKLGEKPQENSATEKKAAPKNEEIKQLQDKVQQSVDNITQLKEELKSPN